MISKYRDRVNPPTQMEIENQKRHAEKVKRERESKPIGRSIGIGIQIDTAESDQKQSS